MSTTFVGRKEDQRLLTGKGQFTDDWNLPNQCYAAFLRSDRAHADIKHIDIATAKSSPGVIAVFTAADIRAENLTQPPPWIQAMGIDGKPFPSLPRDVLAYERVRCVGQPVVLVVAETRAQAQDAVELIEVEYRDLPAVVD